MIMQWLRDWSLHDYHHMTREDAKVSKVSSKNNNLLRNYFNAQENNLRVGGRNADK